MLDLDVRTYKDSLTLIQSLQRLHGKLLSGSTATNVLALIGKPDTSGLFSVNGAVPNWCWGLYGNDLVILIDGLSSVQQGAQLFATSQSGVVTSPIGGINSYALSAAKSIYSVVTQNGMPLSPAVLVSGYSYGGALAQIVASLLNSMPFPAVVQCATFGSPRIGDTGFVNGLAPVTLRRYMNDDDPVPLFPPHFVEAPAASIAVGFGTVFAWSKYIQGHGGIVEFSDGTTLVSNLPPEFLPITEGQLAAWVSGATPPGGDAHSLFTYVSRVALSAAREAQAKTPANTGSGPEVYSPVTLQTFLADAATFAAALKVALALEGKTVLYVPPVYRPRVIFSFDTYHVNWMGYTIADCPTKSNAKTIAKYIFKAMRELVDANPTYSGSMQNAWRDFLTAAANPANGFLPPLNVT